MRRLINTVLITVIIIGPGLISGKNYNFYLSPGVAASVGDLSHRAPFGFMGKAGFGIKPAPISSPELELLIVGQVHFFPTNKDNYSDLSFILAGLETRLHLYPTGMNGFYVTISGGYAYTRIEEQTYELRLGSMVLEKKNIPEIIEHNPYLSPGFGYEFGSKSGLRFFVEGRFTYIFGTYIKNITYLPFSLGIKF